MSELISVILPAYNAEHFIEESIGSILEQTYCNIELIIVNDGSTDGTAKLSEELAAKDSRIKVIHQENQGVSAARNNGLIAAKGDYIGFIDADDIAAEDLYGFLYRNIKKYSADISHCGFEHRRPQGSVPFHGTGVFLVQNKLDALKELISGRRVEPSACTKLYKKEVLQEVLFPIDIKINEDLLFNIEAFNNAEKSVFEDVVKYAYRLKPKSASRSNNFIESSKDVYIVANRIKKSLTSSEIKNEAEIFYTAKVLNILKTLKAEKLFKTDFAMEMRKEIKQMNTSKMGLRIRMLKRLLVDYPFLYEGFIRIYNMFFAKNQKWK